MAAFNNYTTKAKEAVHRAHQLAVERGQNLLTLDIVRSRSEQKLKARLERTLAKAA